MKVYNEAGAQLLSLNQLDLRSSSTCTAHTKNSCLHLRGEVKWRTDMENNGTACFATLIIDFYSTFLNNSNIVHLFIIQIEASIL
jgi:hypothetical protein